MDSPGPHGFPWVSMGPHGAHWAHGPKWFLTRGFPALGDPEKFMLPGPQETQKVEIYKKSGDSGLNHDPR